MANPPPRDPNATSWNQTPAPRPVNTQRPPSSDPEMTFMEDAQAIRAAAQRAGGTTRLEPMAIPPSDPAITHISPQDMAALSSPQGAPPSHPDATTWEDAASVAAAAGLGPTRVQGPAASGPTIMLDAAEASGLAQGPTRLLSPSVARSGGAGVDSALAAGLSQGQGLTWTGGDSGSVVPGSVVPGSEGMTRAAGPQSGRPQSAASSSAPQQVGRYVIERAIAGGGMGMVYLAHDPQLNRKVALKVMRPLGGDFSRRFQVEARASARLDHPNIVSVYDAGEQQGRPYLVMALIEGESLQDRLDREGPFAPEEVARIGIALAEALGYAHSQDVLHRDLKPENVLITHTGRPLITDFGLAKLAAAQGGPTDLTQPGTVLGTPAYMSPEQAQGLTDRIDTRTDVYSLGATLYSLLTHKPPVDGADASAVIQAVPRGLVPNPCTIRPSLPVPLVDVVMRCLSKSPADRFASMAALKQGLLDAQQGGAPAPAPLPAQPSELKSKAPQRRRSSSRAAALAAPPVVEVSDRTGQTVLLVALAVALFAFAFLGVMLSGSGDDEPAVTPSGQVPPTPASPAASPVHSPAASPAHSPPPVENPVEQPDDGRQPPPPPPPRRDPEDDPEEIDDDWGTEEDAWGGGDDRPPPPDDGGWRPPPRPRDGRPPPHHPPPGGHPPPPR